jgi:hypothetical protein
VSLVSHIAGRTGRGSIDLTRESGHDGRRWLLEAGQVRSTSEQRWVKRKMWAGNPGRANWSHGQSKRSYGPGQGKLASSVSKASGRSRSM